MNTLDISEAKCGTLQVPWNMELGGEKGQIYFDGDKLFEQVTLFRVNVHIVVTSESFSLLASHTRKVVQH